MGRVSALVLLTPVLVAVGLVPRADAQDPPAQPQPAKLRLGVLSGMFRDVPPVIVQSVADPFRQLFKKHTGLEGDVEVIDDHETLATKMNNGALQFGVFHGFEWAWVRGDNPNLRPLVVTVPPKKLQPGIVVHVDAKAATPAQLKGAEVLIPVGTKAHGYLYAEKLLENLPPGSFCLKKHQELGSESLLDAVAQGKAPAALVDAAALIEYQQNKPGAGKQLRVLDQSAPFPPTVIAYHKDKVDANVVEKVRKALVNTSADSQGRAFLFLWRLKGFESVPDGYEADLQRTLKAYPSPVSKTKVDMPK